MKNKGFTLIELIMSIVIMGIVVVTVALAYGQIINSMVRSTDISKAVNLSELEFSIVNSISYTDASLANGTNTLAANYQSSGYDLRRQVSYDFGTDATPQSLKRITVTVYRTGSSTPLISTTTLRAKNVNW